MRREPGAIDPEDRERALASLRASQRLVPAVLAGSAAAAVGAAAWTLVAVLLHQEWAWLAIGVGWLTGWAVRRAGRGFEVRFAALGALLAVSGIVAGKLLSLVALVAAEADIGFWEAFARIRPEHYPALLRETFQVMDLLFYGFAVWFAWKGSRVILPDDAVRLELERMRAER
jgi:hypothetical protein